MLPILIFALISTMVLPGSEAKGWIGTFELGKTCNTTGCCCPSADLVISNSSGTVRGSVTPTGFDCMTKVATPLLINDTTAKQYNISLLGYFALLTNGNVNVSLEQVDDNPNDCTITMARKNTVTTNGNTTNDNNTKPQPSTAALLDHSSILIKFVSIITMILVIKHI